MASRNELKEAGRESGLFHVYNRGVNRENIFRNGTDYREFLQCFRRHLCAEVVRDPSGRPYRKLHDAVAIVAYCPMPNHYHLILRQKRAGGMSALMRSATIGYAQYFNAKYNRDGPVFRGRYKAAPIETDDYARRAIAYVHLNHPTLGREYELCSHAIYSGERKSSWIDSETGLELFGGFDRYSRYLDDYEAWRRRNNQDA